MSAGIALLERADAADRPWRAGPATPADDERVLRRLVVQEGATGEGDADAPFVACAVDVETTGLNPDDDVVVELALRRFRHDGWGVITEIGRPWVWREDPGRPLPPEVARLTGLTDADLAGREIDGGVAERIIRSADLLIAHNARFDRPHVERRLPGIAGRPWACSLAEVDWAGRGIEPGKLGWMLAQAGWFHERHRADADVDAVIALMRHRFADGSTALADLLARSGRDGWIVQAVGAAIGLKDTLKARGYSWNPKLGFWWREVASDEEREREEWWLAANVYSAGAGARALAPRFERVTCRERWS